MHARFHCITTQFTFCWWNWRTGSYIVVMVFILTYHRGTRCRRGRWAQLTGCRDDAFSRRSTERVACYDSRCPACAGQHGPVCIKRTYTSVHHVRDTRQSVERSSVTHGEDQKPITRIVHVVPAVVSGVTGGTRGGSGPPWVTPSRGVTREWKEKFCGWIYKEHWTTRRRMGVVTIRQPKKVITL